MKIFLAILLLAVFLPSFAQEEDAGRFMVVKARIVGCLDLDHQVIAVARIRQNEPTVLLEIPTPIDHDAQAKRIREDLLDAIEAQEGFRPETIEVELLDSLAAYRAAQKEHIDSLKTLLANRCAPFYTDRLPSPGSRSPSQLQRYIDRIYRDLPDIPTWRLEEEIEGLEIKDLVKSVI